MDKAETINQGDEMKTLRERDNELKESKMSMMELAARIQNTMIEVKTTEKDVESIMASADLTMPPKDICEMRKLYTAFFDYKNYAEWR